MKMIRPAKTAEKLDISPTTLWRRTKDPGFPKPYRLGPNTVAFSEDEIDKWIASRRTSAEATERRDLAAIAGR